MARNNVSSWSLLLAAATAGFGVVFLTLVGAYDPGRSPTRATPGLPAGEVAASAQPALSAPVGDGIAAPAVPAATWTQLAAGEYRGAIESLKASGVPGPVIHDIILGSVARRYAPQLLALRRSPCRFWQPVQRHKLDDSDPQVRQERLALGLEAEREALVQSVLGTDWASWESMVSGQPNSLDALSEFVSAAAQPRMRKILGRYETLEKDVVRSASGTLGLMERAELDRLYTEKISELQQFLTPEEIEQFEMRTSSVAEDLRQVCLVGFSPSPEEFQSIFRAQKAREAERVPAGGSVGASENTPAVLAQDDPIEIRLRAELGDRRYAEYQRSMDYTYRGLVELTGEFDLPESAAGKVHAFRESILRQVQQVRSDASLDASGRERLLHEVRAQAEDRVKEYLGEPAFRRYTQLQIAGWLDEIEQR